MSYCGRFSEVYVKLSHLACLGLGKRHFEFSIIPSQEGGRKNWKHQFGESESAIGRS